MERYTDIDFTDSRYCIRTLSKKTEVIDAFRFRYDVFCQKLGWIQPNPYRLDIDAYDSTSISLGLYTEADTLLGTVRITPPGESFMLETEFRELLPPLYNIEHFRRSAELSRLAIDPSVDRRAASYRHLSLLLYKGVYQWCIEHDVRYVYFVVDPRYLRALSITGMPVAAISSPRKIPPAYVESVAAILDWERLGSGRNRKLLDWITEGRRLQLPSQRSPMGGLLPEIRSLGHKRGS